MIDIRLLKEELLKIKVYIDELDKPMDDLWEYYRFQDNTDLRNTAGALNRSWDSIREIDFVIANLQELIDLEEEQNETL